MFMDINENQKAVSKNLRNTLIENLLWDSSDKKEQKQSLISRIAQRLGTDKNSALYGRVLIGENTETEIRCIKIESIAEILSSGVFLSKYDNKGITFSGFFDKGDNQATFDILYPYLRDC